MTDDGRPGYWMNETSGILRPVVTRYLDGQVLTPDDVKVMRGYLRQWINAPGFIGEGVRHLRRAVDRIENTGDVDTWLGEAEEEGIDPL